MSNLLTPLDIVNQALRKLGAATIASFTESTKEADLSNRLWPTTRDAVLEEHFWNFATVRATLSAFSEPAGTLTPGAVTGTGVTFTTSITAVFGLDAVSKRLVGDGVAGDATIAGFVTSSPAATLTPASGALTPEQTGVNFTASVAVFAAADVGKIIENRSAGGTGSARITAFTSATVVVATILSAFDAVTAIASASWRLVRTDQVTADITTNFAGVTAIASGSWRLYNAAPNWDFSFSLTVPASALRIQRTQDSEEYQREGDVVVADSEEVPVTYLNRVTDVTRYPAYFVSVLVARLCAELAEPITGQLAKQQQWMKTYDLLLRVAKIKDGQEGSAQRVRSTELVGARFGWKRSITDWWRSA